MFLHACTTLAGGTAAYADNNWVQNLEKLGLSESDYEKARILLASRDAGFRQGMLGGSKVDSNKRVILMALGEFCCYRILYGIVSKHEEVLGSSTIYKRFNVFKP